MAKPFRRDSLEAAAQGRPSESRPTIDGTLGIWINKRAIREREHAPDYDHVPVRHLQFTDVESLLHRLTHDRGCLIASQGERSAEAVADHQPPAGLVEQRGVGLQVDTALGLQGQRHQLARRHAAQLVKIERSDLGAGVAVVDYLEHGVFLLRSLIHSGGYAAFISGEPVHNI